MARIKITPMARIALWALRIYLLVLLSLIGLKFIRGFGESKPQADAQKAGAVTLTNLPPSK